MQGLAHLVDAIFDQGSSQRPIGPKAGAVGVAIGRQRHVENVRRRDHLGFAALGEGHQVFVWRGQFGSHRQLVENDHIRGVGDVPAKDQRRRLLALGEAESGRLGAESLGVQAVRKPRAD
ncbi:hypothetical protein D3C80_1848660 [compost metagenome]